MRPFALVQVILVPVVKVLIMFVTNMSVVNVRFVSAVGGVNVLVFAHQTLRAQFRLRCFGG